MKRKAIFNIVQILLLIFTMTAQGQPLTKFSTGGHTVYHLDVGTIDGDRVTFSASYDGFVMCHDRSGRLLFKADTGEGFPFDIASGDIDTDGNDEVFVASSDGNIYAIDDDGTIMWVFEKEAPMYQVHIVHVEGSAHIFCGGVDRILYQLDEYGNPVRQHNTGRVIRLINSGDVMGDGKQYLAVAAARIALSGKFQIHLFDMPSLNKIWTKDLSYSDSNDGRFFSMEVFDIDKDGKEELVLEQDHTKPERRTIVQEDGSYSEISTAQFIRKRAYTMNLLSHIKSDGLNDEYLIVLYGRTLLFFDLNGNVLKTLDGRYAYNAGVFDSVTNTYIVGSELSGGDGIYAFQLDEPGWQNAFINLQPVGKMVELNNNLDNFKTQIINFTPPAYQEEVTSVDVALGEKGTIYSNYESTGYFNKVEFAHYDHLNLTENYDRSFLQYGWANKRDNRQKYNLTGDQIIAAASEYERTGRNFFLWAGHGMDPFYMRLETMEGILKAAPNTFKAFVFAELEQTNDAMRYVVESHLVPLAQLCRENGNKKILLRNKNIFWTGTVYLDLWDNLFSDERFGDIFVPSMEETNSRSQSLSLSGRTGLWMNGTFNTISGRAVTDNSNYNRLWEWCQTGRLSNQIRSMSQRRLQGADLFHINIHTGNHTDMIPFYLMLEKGILPKVKPNQIISMNKVAVGMKSPPDADYITHGVNGHDINTYSPNAPELVIDRLDCYWGGAPVPENDLTRILFNSKRRMTNFISRAPFGNVSTIPANTDLANHPFFTDMVVTDGKYWYDENNNQLSPEAYRNTLISKFENSAGEMPVRVTGDVAWSAIMIDSSVIRVVLIDPGYLDPDEREAQIHINGLDGFLAKDILSGEKLSIDQGVIDVVVPMGIMRIIDLFCYPIASAGDDIHIRGAVPDSVIIEGSALDEMAIVSQSWSKVSGPECTMLNVDSFKLVVKNLEEGEYVFRFTVKNSEGDSDSDAIKLTVFCIPCRTPDVTICSDRFVQLPKDTVLLLGSASVERGTIASYLWEKVSGPDVAISGLTTPQATLNNLQEGLYIFRFTVTSSDNIKSSAQVSVKVLALPDSIPKAKNPWIIDGILDQTCCYASFSIEKATKGFSNSTANANISWNENYLYVYVSVLDKFLVHDSGNDWWDDDAIELFIDSDNSKDESFGEKDFRYGFRWHWTESGKDMFEAQHNAITGVVWKIKEVMDGYNLEAAIPWATLKHQPSVGDEIGIELRLLIDDDGLINDAIKAHFGYSEQYMPMPVQFGTAILGGDDVSLLNNEIHLLPVFTVYPSITDGLLYVTSTNETRARYTVRDITGREISSATFFKATKIDLRSANSGIYLVCLSQNGYYETCVIVRK